MPKFVSWEPIPLPGGISLQVASRASRPSASGPTPAMLSHDPNSRTSQSLALATRVGREPIKVSLNLGKMKIKLLQMDELSLIVEILFNQCMSLCACSHRDVSFFVRQISSICCLMFLTTREIAQVLHLRWDLLPMQSAGFLSWSSVKRGQAFCVTRSFDLLSTGSFNALI